MAKQKGPAATPQSPATNTTAAVLRGPKPGEQRFSYARKYGASKPGRKGGTR